MLTWRECWRSAGGFALMAMLVLSTIAVVLWLGVRLTGLHAPFGEPVVGVRMFTYFMVGTMAMPSAKILPRRFGRS